MPMNDDASDQSLPIFLSPDGDEAAQHRSSRLRIAGVVILTVAAIAGAGLAFGYPARLAAVPTLFVGASEPEPDMDRAVLPVQSDAGALAASHDQSDQPTDHTASAEPATAGPAAAADEPQQAEAKDKVASDALFAQFQAWAEKQNGAPEAQQTPAEDNVRQLTRDAPVQSARRRPSAESAQGEAARTTSAAAPPVRTAHKRRAVHELRNARAEMEAARRSQAKLSRLHGAPTRAMEDVNTQEAPAPASQPPSLLQILGLR